MATGDGLPGGEPKEPGTDMVLRKREAMGRLEIGSGPINIEKLANELASICAEDLDQTLTPTVILNKMIGRGFPAGLASYLGSSLLERIKDARQSLAVAVTKPKLRDSLISTVQEEIVEYLQSRHTEIVQFGEVSQDLNKYMRIISEAVIAVDASTIPDQDLVEAFAILQKMGKKGKERLTRPITQYVLEIIQKEGLDVKMLSDTVIVFKKDSKGFEQETYGKMFTSSTGHYTGLVGLAKLVEESIQKKFSRARVKIEQGSYEGVHGTYVRVSYMDDQSLFIDPLNLNTDK